MIILLDHRGGFTASIDGGPATAVDNLAAFVALHERSHPRWVWDDTSWWYPQLLEAGVRVERCWDLRLCHVILRSSLLTTGSALARASRGAWDEPRPRQRAATDDALFALDDEPRDEHADPATEYAAQRAAVEGSAQPARIELLLAVESAGALIAAELRHAGLPWDRDAHDAILTELLGPRPRAGERPAKLSAVLERVSAALDMPDLNPDSPVELLRSLRLAGLNVNSTGKWELREHDHPVVEPLLEYKSLARLLSANGWAWLDAWVVDGRFRPDYVPGGVVTGRWATSGGGALQLPRQIRGAVVADPGWSLVVADASQLEPRILAALAGDGAMIAAGAQGDLYAGMVASGAVDTREHAKVGMLGAMYGGTTGASGQVLPRLARAFPQAIGLVEEAARAGERGERVMTRLGRTSPLPSEAWAMAQSDAGGELATAASTAQARSRARAWGRFTRNFVVQGTAAEWALCWMAGIRRGLTELAAGAWFTESAHLVFFLHDEVVVHAPSGQADRVVEIVQEAAADAGRLLFSPREVAFPLTVAVVRSYGEAK